jgi:hypothetical protein
MNAADLTALPAAELEAEQRLHTIRWRNAQIKEQGLRKKRDKRLGKHKGRPSVAGLRVRDLDRLFLIRYGNQLPNDDAGREDAFLMATHLVVLANGRQRVLDWCRRCAPWYLADLNGGLLDRLVTQPYSYRAETLGKKLRLTIAERDQLKITTIRAVDFSKAQMDERRREKNRKRKAAKRRAAGARSQAESFNRLKPWERLGLGISRRTFYRHMKKGVEQRVAQLRRQHTTCSYAGAETVPLQLAPSESRAPALLVSLTASSRLHLAAHLLRLTTCSELVAGSPSQAATIMAAKNQCAHSGLRQCETATTTAT